MISSKQIKAMMKETGKDFRAKFREQLGVEMKRYPSGEYPYKVKPTGMEQEIDIVQLYKEWVGEDTLHTQPHTMFQEDAIGVNPSAFSNVSLWSSVTAGLVEARVLAGYDSPDFIGDEFVEDLAIPVNGSKFIGIPRTKQIKRYSLPGEEYPSVGMQEKWVIGQPLNKAAQKIDITREDLLFSVTGDILARAQGIGYSLRLAREVQIACGVMGVNLTQDQSDLLPPGIVGNSFIYDGAVSDTPANTYQSAAGTGGNARYNYLNLSTSTALSDYTSINVARQLLAKMKEYETNLPIFVQGGALLVSPQQEYKARIILRATTLVDVPAGFAQTGNIGLTVAPNVVDQVPLRFSPIWNRILLDNGFSQANSDALWYFGDFKKAFIFQTAWPFSQEQSPMSADLFAKDIIARYKASWYGRVQVRDPHYVTCLGANINSPS